MKKIIIVLFIIFCLTGCSSNYNIKITNDKIEESIVGKIDSDDVPILLGRSSDPSITSDDQLTPFLKNDQYPLINDFDTIYKKDVKEEDGGYYVTLKYEYTLDSYKNSRTYNCFENRKFDLYKNVYSMDMSGHFYCLYGDETIINIETDYKVINNNADSVNGNIYTWVINHDNLNRKSIILSFENGVSLKTMDPMIKFALALIVLVVFSLFIYVFVIHKYKKSNTL